MPEVTGWDREDRAPQTQIGEGANDALLMALAKGELDDFEG